ncbi:MAG: WYL domain-containing protein [Herpetosiphon sp.]|nr:WYL domain-containing protein [Herpetosiphon sp.]
MKHKDSRYERLDKIERLLARSHEGLMTSEVANELNVDQSTIIRDLEMLERRGTGLIKDGWRYRIDHRRSLYTIKFNNDEMLALFIAMRLLSRHSDEHNPHVVRAMEKLADALRDKSPLIAQHIDRAANAVRMRRSRPEYVEALETITQSWASFQKVTFSYRNAQGEHSDRTFSPYFIEPSGIGYACHVIGFDEKRNKILTFKIERMYNVRITNDVFHVPKEFDPQKLLANAWGVIWRDEGSIEVVLEFSPNVHQRITESVWHHSQQLEELPHGGCLLRVHVGSTMEMKPWIRQWGADVTVLEPADLRHEIRAEIIAMAGNYGLEVHHEPTNF